MTNTPEQIRSKKIEESFHLGVIGTSGLILSIIIPMLFSEEDWFKPYWMPTFWLGIATFITFIILSIELALKDLLQYSTLKIMGAFAFSTLILSANILAASDINEVFGVSASALPYTFSVITAAKLIIILKPLLIVLFIAGLLLFIANIIDWYKIGIPRYIPLIFSIGAIIGGGYPWHIVNNYLNSEELPLKIYTIAHQLDFSKNYNCTNIKDGYSVIFIGAGQNRVLIDKRIENNHSARDYIYVKKENSPIQVPRKFPIFKCAARE
ncbi:MAG: hypothetical protein CVV07_13650 [Gammaproteobacteria bacterium HGW-Gammaproteobacteria-11]|nr:MAG: hypothetical protein CVV07_13650 [Gammaproteobacteria bacterium HGW-Gammaproteobacteria-11]